MELNRILINCLHNGFDNDSNYLNLGKKRQRENKELVIVPKNLDVEELRNRNQSLANSGFTKLFNLKNEKIQFNFFN